MGASSKRWWRARTRAARTPCADERNQRHADGRRHARAADHLHGRGAAAASRNSCRSPGGEGTQIPTPKQEPLAVTVKLNGDVYIGETQVGLDDLATKLKAIAKNGYDETIFVRGDKGVSYGVVMKVMGRINDGGFKKLSFVLDQEKGGS